MKSTSLGKASFCYYEGGPDRTFVLQQSTQLGRSRLQGIIPKDERLAFYELNYEAIAMHVQAKNEKVYLGSKRNRTCRFCGKSEQLGETTFKLEAHGFPSSIGNRTFFTNYECDICNEDFGNGIENQLGIYLKPYRTLAAVRGHRSVPKIKNTKEGWRIWRDDDGLHIFHETDRRVATVSEDGKTLDLAIPRDPYRPLDVYRAFVKMALSLMPKEEIGDFQETISWIKGKASFRFIPPTISTTFVEGMPINAMSALLMKRKADTRELPYMMALLIVANTQFQFMVPCLGKDEHLRNLKIRFPSYPWPIGMSGDSQSILFDELNLSDERTIKDEVVRYSFAFDTRIEKT